MFCLYFLKKGWFHPNPAVSRPLPPPLVPTALLWIKQGGFFALLHDRGKKQVLDSPTLTQYFLSQLKSYWIKMFPSIVLQKIYPNFQILSFDCSVSNLFLFLTFCSVLENSSEKSMNNWTAHSLTNQKEKEIWIGVFKNYDTRAIISRSLYIFYPFFTAVYSQELLLNITDNLCTKERNSSIKSAVYNQEQFQIKSGL